MARRNFGWGLAMMTSGRQMVIFEEISNFHRNQRISYYVARKFCANHPIYYKTVISTKIKHPSFDFDGNSLI